MRKTDYLTILPTSIKEMVIYEDHATNLSAS